MARVKKKISYIKKPFSRKSFVSVGFAAAALICCGFSLGLSVSHQGNGGLNVAAWGLSSLIFSLIGGFYGLISFMEKEKNYLFAKIGLGVSAALLIVWIALVIAGITG